MVKNLPALRETQVRSLGQEDALEKGMANHSSIIAWRIPWTEEPGSYSPWGCKELEVAVFTPCLYIIPPRVLVQISSSYKGHQPYWVKAHFSDLILIELSLLRHFLKTKQNKTPITF